MDDDKVSEELNSLDWSCLTESTNADEIQNIFESKVGQILDANAPIIKRRVKGRNTPWMTKEIMDLRWERDEKRRIFYRTKSDDDKRVFIKSKHFVQNKIASAKRNYFLKKCDAALTSAQVWNVYNELSNFRTKRRDPIPDLKIDGIPSADPSRKCDALAEEFALPGSDDSD